MTETDQKTAETPGVGPEAVATPAEPRPVSEEAGCEEAIEQLAGASADVQRLEAEKADLTDRLLRVAADMDNFRRRSERDIQDARKYAVAKFAGDMLTVADNLKRALSAVPAASHDSGDEAFKALLDGVEMTGREMDRLLEKNGIARIAAEGERFDPNRHQAMFEIPDPSVPAGTVAQVVQEGYTIGDRVLRAAMVAVSRDGPTAAQTTPESSASRPAEGAAEADSGTG